MKQTRLAPLVDTVAGTAVAFFVALGVQWLVAVWYGLPLRMSDNAAIVAVFTVVSLVRGYAWRRFMESVHVRRALSPFMQAAIAERFAHVEREGFDAKHDDAHIAGELALAGACYALQAASVHIPNSQRMIAQLWPWSAEWWKPADMRRNLAKATALIIAEGDRHDRNRRRGSREFRDWDYPRPPKTGSGVR